MANEPRDARRVDEPTGTEFVGHEWDGIEELDTPMPRWWLWTFYATIVWAAIYTVLYPAWPLLDRATSGLLGWSSRGQLERELARAEKERGAVLAKIAATPIEQLPLDEELMRQAIAGGAAAFKVNCVQCHGAGAAGSKGYPNLNDDDWLWGGDLASIEYTITHGIRWSEDPQTRNSQMPAFAGMFDEAQIDALVRHVRSLGGQGKGDGQGAALFAENCAICHGPNGQGDRTLGAPRLNDAIWLYGDEPGAIRQQILSPRHGVMPAWKDRLDPATIRMLAAYVHSLGGGEESPANGEPATSATAPTTEAAGAALQSSGTKR